MTSTDDVHDLVVACYGGANRALIDRRTPGMSRERIDAALRLALISGAVIRDDGEFKPRDRVEEYCVNCGLKVDLNNRAPFRGQLVFCPGCNLRRNQK